MCFSTSQNLRSDDHTFRFLNSIARDDSGKLCSVPSRDGFSLAVKASCVVSVRTYEEDAPYLVELFLDILLPFFYI